jgi:hypothetical protein
MKPGTKLTIVLTVLGIFLWLVLWIGITEDTSSWIKIPVYAIVIIAAAGALSMIFSKGPKESLKEEVLRKLRQNLRRHPLIKQKAKKILDDYGRDNKFLRIRPMVLEVDDHDDRGRAIKAYMGGYELAYTMTRYIDPEGKLKTVWGISALFNRNLDPIPDLCPICKDTMHLCQQGRFSITESWHRIGGNSCERARRAAQDLTGEKERQESREGDKEQC